jgi:cell division protein FtsN
MKRQSGYGGFPSIFLTFSLLLLVLAVGFVVGRLVVARLYLSQAPKFSKREAAESDTAVSVPEPAPRLPGRVYVPPPAPPEEPPETAMGLADPGDGMLLDEDERQQGPEESQSRSSDAQPGPAQASGVATRVRIPEPAGDGAKPEAPPDGETRSGRRYSVQVGVFSTEQGARKLEDELRGEGRSTRIEVEGRDGQTLYRVLTGSYRTEYEARRAVEELRREGHEAFLVDR